MQIEGAVALVTGGNRGLGDQFVKALLDRGAAKVYAAARNPDTVTTPGAVPLRSTSRIPHPYGPRPSRPRT